MRPHLTAKLARPLPVFLALLGGAVGEGVGAMGTGSLGSPCPVEARGPLAVQGESEAEDDSPSEAPEATLRGLLTRWAEALEAGDATAGQAVLGEMLAFDNDELRDVAEEALEYESGEADEALVDQQAEELGMTSMGDREDLRRALEVGVQGLGARLLANFEDRKAQSVLLASLKDKKLCKGKPKLIAALIDALGRLKCAKAEKIVEGHFRQFGDRDVMQASIRFFGQLPTRDKGTARALAELLEPPAPADVNSPTNPPASYWAARWEQWNYFRRDVTWSLQQITGEVFRPAEGDHPGDSVRALKFIKENARRLGLR